MPHKHKRKQNDKSTYDLPPTLIAKSLPVRDPSKQKHGKGQQANGKGKGKGKQNANQKAQAKGPAAKTKQNEAATSRQKSELEDDTPRAFRQLMQMQARHQARAAKKQNTDSDSSGSDSGDSDSDRPAPRNKKTATKKTTSTEPSETGIKEKTAPKILPGEKLSDFAARVDREMPLSQMQRTAKSNQPDNLPKIRDHKVTKHEKHLKRLQKQWREDDVRIKEREAAEQEEKEEEMEEQLQLWKDWDAEAGKKKRNPNHSQSSGKKRKGAGDDDDGPDPWAKLKKKRATVNPFDVAQEPPQLKKPREIFKMRGGAKVDVANVPAGAGSLRRREELASERRNIVEEYRKLMAEKRGA
ncbi:hypothetical protein BDV18DRAFT_135769 [Aspergillus unguis]